jgi:flagellin-like hook-associated protein FlgL
MRVTNKMLINTVLRDLFNNNRRMIRLQDQVATGRIVNNPSEDPLISDQVINLDMRVARAVQYVRNGQAATSFLSLADSTLGDVGELGITARTLAVKMANDTMTATIRAESASEVDQLLEEAVSLGNRRFRERYIFSGHQTDTPPFEITSDGVLYHGDLEHIRVQLTDNSINRISVNGADAFGAFDARVIGSVDLNPRLDITADGTRLSDLNAGSGVALGVIRIVHSGGTVSDIDLAHAETIEDVAAMINDGTGGALTVSVAAGGNALQVAGGGGPITVQEVGGGTTARDLGILGAAAGPLLVGADVDPTVTRYTKMSSLRNGAGLPLDLASGFTITNGSQTATFSGADINGTVGDLIEALNASNVNVLAEISAGGTGLNIYSRVNGATMTITENGGSTAADLGVLEVAGVRADNIFTALMDLRDALQVNDRAAVSNSITVLDGAMQKMLTARGEIGARVQRTETIGRRQEDEEFNLTKLLSETNDLDYASAATDFQNLRNIMEAALSMTAQTIPRSLADFL